LAETDPGSLPGEAGQANFVACHQFTFLERFDMLKYARPGGVFLLNSMYGPDDVWDNLPREVQETIIEKKLKFYNINAYDVAEKTGMGQRINTIMQTCFLRHQRRAAARTGHRADQVRYQEDVWQTR
jgi:Pyruvate/2-oxoacid:ferredoxin oxidoreductase gamma subunit